MTGMRMLGLLLALWAAAMPGIARADVVLTFYSREGGEMFPHAFIAASGRTAAGEPVEMTAGFTAETISPGVLLGSVRGKVDGVNATYQRKSRPHFSMRLNDAQYRMVLAKVAEWRAKPQKSYNLNRQNCVHFVADVARALGFRVNAATRFWRKPTSFLAELRSLNAGLVTPLGD